MKSYINSNMNVIVPISVCKTINVCLFKWEDDYERFWWHANEGNLGEEYVDKRLLNELEQMKMRLKEDVVQMKH